MPPQQPSSTASQATPDFIPDTSADAAPDFIPDGPTAPAIAASTPNVGMLDPHPETGVGSFLGDALRGGVSNVYNTFRHPIQTIESQGQGIMAGRMTPYGAPINAPTGNPQIDAANADAQNQAQASMAQQGQVLAEHPGYAIGSVVGPLLAGKMLGAAFPDMEALNERAANKLTAAVGGKLNEQIKTALPELAEQVKQNPVHDIYDLQDAVGKTKQGLEDQVNTALAPLQNQEVAAHPISDKILSLITPAMQKTAAGRAEIAQIKQAALEYQQPWTLGELNDQRMRLNNGLTSYYKKSALGQYGAAKSDVDIAIDKAAADGARDTVYDALDRSQGVPQNYFRGLKQKQAALIQLEDQLDQHTTDLENKTATIKGTPRLSRANVTTHIGQSGTPHMNVYGLTNLIKKPNPLADANSLASSAFRAQTPLGAAVTASGVPLRYLTMLPAGHPLNLTQTPAQTEPEAAPAPVSANAPR